MKLEDLSGKSIIILGVGAEGQATYEFFRKNWPSKPLALADRRRIEEFPREAADRFANDPLLTLHFGPEYLSSLGLGYDVIVKAPGIPGSVAQIREAKQSGSLLTSHSQIFLSNYPRKRIIGVTGTKGKSTTASLIYQILRYAGIPAELVGNIGVPPLTRLGAVSRETYFVHEFSSHQLAEIESSPHIAVLLNIVPEHLDYYATFAEYAAAKENLTKFQNSNDFLIFNADYALPGAIAQRTRAARIPFSTKTRYSPGCYLQGDSIVWAAMESEHHVMNTGDVPLPGRFNVQNVLAAVAAACLCGADPAIMRDAVKEFRALPHRLELVGTFNGITFYDDSIATVPDATLAALEALGENVQTVILGGHERNLDFSDLGARLPAGIRTLILFPPTGERIWKAVEAHSKNSDRPQPFPVETMAQAVKIAYARTDEGRICLLSPASPSFGLFRDYRERGESFKASVRQLARTTPEP